MPGTSWLPLDRRPPATVLPEFPWDKLLVAKQQAAAHPDGIVDLSVGTPVDPVCTPVRSALASAADAPGYPSVLGRGELRRAYVNWLQRAHGVTGLEEHAVLPTIGSKELVASLPRQLGVRAGDSVVIPVLAYPTYEVGVLEAGATVVRSDMPWSSGIDRPAMVWINSPGNPSGTIWSVEDLSQLVAWARERGTVVVSDECYLDLGWDAQPISILHPEVSGGDHTGLLAVHSLSKRSNLAGYRAGFVSGDRGLIDGLLALRKHLGLMMPTPIQAAATAALQNDAHVLAQSSRYRDRRTKLWDAFSRNGFSIGDDQTSAGGLYLWATEHRDAADTVSRLAERGILVAPGSFYGPSGARHVRIALTATDERVDAAVQRLAR